MKTIPHGENREKQHTSLRTERSLFQIQVDALFSCATYGDMGAIKSKINTGLIGINVRNDRGETVLMKMAERLGGGDNVRYLVEKLGADARAIDNYGLRASQHASAHKGSMETVEYLRSKEQDIA